MKDKMTKEEINKKMEEEHLEEVSGGFNSLHRKVGGYADSNVVHTVLNKDTDAKNSHPVMDGKEKPVAANLKKESMLGTPVLVDTNDVEKKRILGGNTLV